LTHQRFDLSAGSANESMGRNLIYQSDSDDVVRLHASTRTVEVALQALQFFTDR